MFLRVLLRVPSAEELEILEREYQRALTYYQQHPKQAAALAEVGQLSPPSDAEQLLEFAATMLLANMLFNLDESLTHE